MAAAKPKRAPGRPGKFTPERVKAILEALRAGCTRTAAAAKGEIDLDTLARWCKANTEFCGDCTRAEADAEARFTLVMAQAASPHEVRETTTTTNPDGTTKTVTTVRREFDWRAAESWLKRRRRGEWGDNVNIDLDTEIANLLAQVAGAGEDSPTG